MSHQILDISSNNEHPINFEQVKASGVDGVLVKATEGTGYTNPYYQGDINAARAAGLKVAAYHYARFGDPEQEAAHFHSVAGADAKALDIETSGDAGWIDQFLADLGQASNQELTYGSASTLPVGGINRGLLWSAAWGSTPPAQGEVLWQYTDNAQVPGIAVGGVDRSAWVGTEDQYQAFFSGNVAPPTPNPVPWPQPGPAPAPPNPPAFPTPVPQPLRRDMPHTLTCNEPGHADLIVVGDKAAGIVDDLELTSYWNAGIPNIALPAAEYAKVAALLTIS